MDIEENRRSLYGSGSNVNDHLLQQFHNSVKPFTSRDWYAASCIKKSLLCLKAPFILVLLFFLPIVNYEEERHGWSKLLNCFQIVTLPLMMILLICKLISLDIADRYGVYITNNIDTVT